MLVPLRTTLTRRSLPFHVTDQDRDAVLLASFETEAQPCFPALYANDPGVFLRTLHPLCEAVFAVYNIARCGARPLAPAGGVPEVCPLTITEGNSKWMSPRRLAM